MVQLQVIGIVSSLLLVSLELVNQTEGNVPQIISSFFREIFGFKSPSSTQRSRRMDSTHAAQTGCSNRDAIRVHLGLEEISKYSSCFLEMVTYGKIWKPDQEKRGPQIIREYGYNFTAYDNVTSKDNYITTIFRISGGPKSPERVGKPAVMLFHGFAGSSDQWFFLGKRSPAFILADAGFEVWLANVRGTDYSQRHKHLDPNFDLNYWDFSFTEVAIYDLPPYIDLILETTQTKKIFYIGHSLGGSIYAAALSELPHLNDKIHASFLLAPAVFIGHATNALRLGSLLLDLDPTVRNILNHAVHGHLHAGSLTNRFLSRFCSSSAVNCGFCGSSSFTILGYDPKQYSFTNIPQLISAYPNAVSFKMFLHGMQVYRSCKFRKYDYGREGNMKKYGSPFPPAFNLWNLRAPVHMYYGDKDDLVSPLDMRIFRDSLPSNVVKEFHLVNWTNFNHFEFTIAKDVDKLVYKRIVQSMNEYLGN